MKREQKTDSEIKRIMKGRAARILAVAVSVFLCALTLFEYIALRMEWDVPALAVISGDNGFWSGVYQKEELAFDDSTENILLTEVENTGIAAAEQGDDAERPDDVSAGNSGSGDRTDNAERQDDAAGEETDVGVRDRADATARQDDAAGEETDAGGGEKADDDVAAGNSDSGDKPGAAAGEETDAGGGDRADDASAGNSGSRDRTDNAERQDDAAGISGGGNAQADDDAQDEPEFPYYIRINRKQNCITVYTLDDEGEYTIPYKAMICSTGLYNATPRGTYQISTKYLWRELYGGVYGQYATRIHGGVLFHSVPYYSRSKNALCTDKYNKLGQQASMGCVRLTVEDAKWIAENCPQGTTVEIYDDDDPGPLGKPEAVKIDTDSPNKGWDPTDPDENNPWHELSRDE